MKKLRKSTWLHRHVYPWIGAAAIRLIATTVRIRYDDPHGLIGRRERFPYIIAFWHSRLFLMPVMYRQALHPRPLTALISPSRDGNLIAEVARRFGIRAARGSSSKKASTGLRELIRAVKEEGSDVIITPDGPRGPKEEIQPGTLYVAQATGAAIVPVDCHYSACWRMRSWDGFVIPKPFSRVTVTVNKPMEVSANLDEAQLEHLRARLTDLLCSRGGKE